MPNTPKHCVVHTVYCIHSAQACKHGPPCLGTIINVSEWKAVFKTTQNQKHSMIPYNAAVKENSEVNLSIPLLFDIAQSYW